MPCGISTFSIFQSTYGAKIDIMPRWKSESNDTSIGALKNKASLENPLTLKDALASPAESKSHMEALGNSTKSSDGSASLFKAMRSALTSGELMANDFTEK